MAVFLTLLPVVMKIISYSSDTSSLSSTLTHKLIVTISTLHLSVAREKSGTDFSRATLKNMGRPGYKARSRIKHTKYSNNIH